MEKAITKTILRDKLYSGVRPAIEFLYDQYGSMLFGFVLQCTSDRREAEDLMVHIFSRLTTRLPDALDSQSSIYCWLQAEAGKIMLECTSRSPGAKSALDGGVEEGF